MVFILNTVNLMFKLGFTWASIIIAPTWNVLSAPLLNNSNDIINWYNGTDTWSVSHNWSYTAYVNNPISWVSSEYTTFPSSLTTALTWSFSISVWCNVTWTSVGGSSFWTIICNADVYWNNHSWIWVNTDLIYNPHNGFRFTHLPAWIDYTADHTWTSSWFYNVIITYDYTSWNCNWYVNGSNVGSGSGTSAQILQIWQFAISAKGLAPGNPITGNVRNLNIYNYVLTAEQCLAIYNQW